MFISFYNKLLKFVLSLKGMIKPINKEILSIKIVTCKTINDKVIVPDDLNKKSYVFTIQFNELHSISELLSELKNIECSITVAGCGPNYKHWEL